MRLRPVDGAVALAAVLVVFLVSLLPSPRDSNPPVPNTPEHRVVTMEKDCLACHASGASHALPARHPQREDCFRCHREPGQEIGESVMWWLRDGGLGQGTNGHVNA